MGDPQTMGHVPFTTMIIRFHSAKYEENMLRMTFGIYHDISSSHAGTEGVICPCTMCNFSG